MHPSVSQISSLQQVLNAALDAFKAELAAQHLSEPSLTTSKPHPLDDITYLPTPIIYESRRAALASLGLLKQLVQAPYDALNTSSMATLEAAGLRLATEVGLSDVLAAAPDPEAGLTITEIAPKVGVEGAKLERILRLLVTQGWYRETSQGTFANNRLSNVIKKDSPGYIIGTYWTQLVHNISGKLTAQFAHPDPAFRCSSNPVHSAFNLAYDTAKPYFGLDSWTTSNPSEGQAFGRVMGAHGVASDPGVAADLWWEELAKGKDAIVDVGGGQGTLSCTLAAKYPNIPAFVVQDLPELRETAESYIKSQGLQDRITFEAQDFFAPQQRQGKYVFVIQRVLHDWSTEDGARILSRIRDVLNDDSTLLIIDTIILNGVIESSGPKLEDSLLQAGQSSIYTPATPPPFVPTDFGEASRFQHMINVILTVLCNSFERTLPQLKEMIELAGLKIKQVYSTRGWASITEVVRA